MVFINYSCLEMENQMVTENDITIENMNIPPDFDYSTSSEIEINLQVPKHLSNAVFSLVAYKHNTDSLPFAKATFNANGIFTSQYTVPAYIDTILVVSQYIGFIDKMFIPITNKKAAFDYRPLYLQKEISTIVEDYVSLKSANASGFSFMGSFTSTGVPNYLVSNDIIQQNLLDDINASLPEYSKVPQRNPEFLAGSTQTNLVLTKEANVWVTFVAEGAGYKNVLGYYTYKVGNAPATKEDIEKLTVIFPNVSANGSGGGLVAGNRVHLGRFPQGTVIGWFLVADGFVNGNVSNGRRIVFSNSEFNPENDPQYRGHMVSLWDKSREQFLLGFEDLDRTPGRGSDEDFNDAVFYATSNPADAIQRNNVQSLVAANDSDGDGINDELDDFPFDPNKSFNNFSPSEKENGTVVFEDLWPSIGDYDFNDLVIDYQYNTIANAANNISNIIADFTIKHVGGSFKNGFAIVLPIAASNIETVKNQVLNSGYLNLNSNGTEAGVEETVIFVTENTMHLVGQTVSLEIVLKEAVPKNLLGNPPYNPFIVVDGIREREVHLPDLQPTSKGRSLLGVDDDYSSIQNGRYFKTNKNLPWALNIYSNFSAPPERVSIEKVYPKFVNWANSGGTKDMDWYK